MHSIRKDAWSLCSGDVLTSGELLAGHFNDFRKAIRGMGPIIWAHELDSIAGRISKASVGVGFKPPPSEVVDEMFASLLDNIEGLTAEQQDQVLEILTDAAEEGQNPIETARALSDVIGLTPHQQGMVDSYRNLLDNTSTQALNRQLRDRRFDSTVENAIDQNDFIDQDTIDNMVERYRDRLLDLRAETIARTESLRVTEQVRANSMDDAIDQAGIDRAFVVKQWSATNDSRTRDTHRGLDGQARQIDEPFDSESGAQLMHPGDSSAPPEEVINCRCTTAYQILSSQQEVDDYLGENG
jgi:hypothetical protein